MWLISMESDEKAVGLLRELYDQEKKDIGYVRNTTRVWANRPELADPWQQLLKSIRSHMRLRAYELVTIAASHAIGCVYCMMVHGGILHKNGFSAQQVIAILEDYHTAGLSPVEVHMMDYAVKISRDASSISMADLEPLRQDGLNDQQITDIALAAAARNFASRLFNALGADADLEVQAQEPELWEYLKDWQKVR